MLKLINYDDELPIHIDILNMKEYPWHTHRDIQILYVLEGSIELKLTYTSYPLEKNDIHFIHSDDVHGIQSLTENNLIILLSINVEYFSKFFPNLNTQIFTTRIKENVTAYQQQQLELKYYIFSILAELYRKKPGYENTVCRISKELINALYKDFRGFIVNRADKIFELRFSHDLFQMDRISRIISLVYENYSYKLSLAEIAQIEHINKYYLSHLFQRFVGENFRDFVSMVRVEMSETKVLCTNLSISQIASESGFSNAKYYVEHFENWFGLHPKDYREQMSGKTIDHKEPVGTVLDYYDIEQYLESYLCQFPAPIPPVSNETSDSIDVDFSAIPHSKFHFLNQCVLQITNPDYYPGDFLEKNFTYLSKRLLHCGIKTKISIVVETAKKRTALDGLEPSSIYYNTYAQGCCIEILTRLIGGSELHALEHIELVDSPENTNGLLTVNGLKKPAYYLCCFLERLSSDILDAGPFHIVTKGEDAFQLLVFNANEEQALHFNWHLLHILTNFKLTEQRLDPSISCIDYWCQLNFQHPISEEDFNHIEHMTMPKIKFEIIPKSAEYTHEVTLRPKEIALILIEKTD